MFFRQPCTKHAALQLERCGADGFGPHQLQILVVLKLKSCECLLLLDAAPIRELSNLQRFCPLNEVWQVKVDDIVSDDDVRIRLYHQVTPPL